MQIMCSNLKVGSMPTSSCIFLEGVTPIIFHLLLVYLEHTETDTFCPCYCSFPGGITANILRWCTWAWTHSTVSWCFTRYIHTVLTKSKFPSWKRQNTFFLSMQVKSFGFLSFWGNSGPVLGRKLTFWGHCINTRRWPVVAPLPMYTNVSHVRQKQLLRSLALSCQMKAWLAVGTSIAKHSFRMIPRGVNAYFRYFWHLSVRVR